MPFDTNQPAYQRFRSIVRERSDQVIAWIGAGLSQPANLPSWTQLRDGLASELDAKARAITGNDGDGIRDAIHSLQRERNLWKSFSILSNNLG